MIRINLLPIKQLKKRARLRQELFILVCLFVFVLVSLATVFQWQAVAVANLKTTNKELTRKKAAFEPLIKEMAEVQKTKEMLDAKVEAIKLLKKKSNLPVHIIDEVSLRTPQDRMWLTALTQNNNTLSLQGIALDNATIAQYMQSMDSSPYFKNSELVNSSLTNVAGQKLKSFSLTISIVLPEEKTEPKPASAG
jgi:type IV pilus assembly protein PilN